jgi:hypothetical protein
LVDFREVKNNSSGMIAAGRRDDEKAMRSRIRDGRSKPLCARLDHSPFAFRRMISIAVAEFPTPPTAARPRILS